MMMMLMMNYVHVSTKMNERAISAPQYDLILHYLISRPLNLYSLLSFIYIYSIYNIDHCSVSRPNEQWIYDHHPCLNMLLLLFTSCLINLILFICNNKI